MEALTMQALQVVIVALAIAAVVSDVGFWRWVGRTLTLSGQDVPNRETSCR